MICMKETVILWADKIIRYGIYALFFLIPLVFTNSTSELFELNKMWLTWEITLVIGAAWITKMIVNRKIRIRRTPLDIPLLLFLLSQIISTLFSLDTHTSLWGYYSRFNGGLFSTITYIFLYYTIASNISLAQVKTIIKVSLASGILVALWGLPSHFGKDPTCLLFRGTLDVSCWTDAFKPTVRIFSSLGQPAWMSAYLNILLPLAMVTLFGLFPFARNLIGHKKHEASSPSFYSSLLFWKFLLGLLVLVLFFACLIFTNTRAGIVAFWIGNAIFWLILGFKRYFPFRTYIQLAILCNLIFFLLHFFFGTSFSQLDRYTLPALQSQPSPVNQTVQNATAPAGALGGTDSGKIRQIVWQGAIDAWKANPLFGSGVETFAFAYYRFRPADHNLTSEWDYLYNKAHNEYLNYLTTTGIVGLGTYLFFIFAFLYLAVRSVIKERPDENSQLVLALIVGFVTILITDFFGFSVVITNLYLFLIPIFVFLLHPKLFPEKELTFPKHSKDTSSDLSFMQWSGITTIVLICFFMIMILIRFWFADKAYALGSNLSNVQEYQQSYLQLGEAVNLRPSEPTFKDEFAVNNAMIATLLLLQDTATPSAEAAAQSQALSHQAVTLSNELIQNHPNNITFWKTRVRIFYTLAQADKRYLKYALDAVKHVHELAPTDAKVMYNLGALYQETGNPQKSAEVLEQTILLKPDYRDAYFALATAYNTMAVDKNTTVTNPEMRAKAIKQLEFILDRLSPDDIQAKQLLSSWQTQ